MNTPPSTSTPASKPVSSSATSANDPSLQSHLHSRAVFLSRLVAQHIFGIATLYPPQVDVLAHLALMKLKASPLRPSSVLFVYPTGGGKLLVRDVHSTLFRGVTLTIVPVLSLGAYLSLKVRQKTSQSCGRVLSIHLDKIQNVVDAKQMIDSVKALPIDTKKDNHVVCLSSGVGG